MNIVRVDVEDSGFVRSEIDFFSVRRVDRVPLVFAAGKEHFKIPIGNRDAGNILSSAERIAEYHRAAVGRPLRGEHLLAVLKVRQQAKILPVTVDNADIQRGIAFRRESDRSFHPARLKGSARGGKT